MKMKCKQCGEDFETRGLWQKHLAEEHNAGPASKKSRNKAILTFRKKNAKVARKSAPKLPSVLKGASFDRDTPWNLGLVDALNMARKSIERSLEIIEGQGK